MTDVVRERNRRGEGARLREEILAAATQLLEESGSEEAVTLRAVARQAGISAPSIYAHFPDRVAIIDAIVDGAFADFNAAIRGAITHSDGPVARLRAGCAAYLRFAAERPNRYMLLFERQEPDAGHGHGPAGGAAGDVAGQPGGAGGEIPVIRTASLDMLVATVQKCIDVGASASTDAFGDAVAIWVALHGYAMLRARVPGFPWPPGDLMLDRLVYGLAKITTG